MRLIDFMAGGAVVSDVWEVCSVKASSKSVKKSDNRIKGAPTKPKIVTSVDSKNVAKKIHQTATKATRIPKKTTTASPTRGKAAKDAGHKKAEFLQILLASWQERGPSKAEKQA